ncbi:winged helix-turn-helix domain-containing protein [Aliikangiella coralliicola]|uniref:OmpR/PhoB-type domain-containing protein n=1 Tax=Aliikangiella coralliicola TaxID=2592383 RepID=A0A545U8L4_9GAMM|nr:winged helix-turn-helix domain-containing protein [Aliikangiella coralliicola]TQV85806.1 hypothetical protein FLL46_17935 [Aliikangiella coralliicola]
MTSVSFANQQLDAERGILVNLTEQSETKLPRKTVQVLTHLINNAGKTISKAELIDVVWDGNEYVGDQGVSNALWRIRKALKEDAANPVYLETIPKVGYKWLVPQTNLLAIEESLQQQPNSEKNWKKQVHRLLFLFVITFLLLATVFVLFSLTNKNLNGVSDDLKVVSASNNFGLERYPAIAPNGDQMLFSWRKNSGKASIFIKQPDSNKAPRQLTDDTHDDLKPVWSPDGDHFAYLRMVKGSQDCNVMLYQLSTDKQVKLAPCLITRFGAASLSWSPSGEFIAYSSDKDTISIIRPDTSSTISQISLIEKTGPFSDFFPTWSADSKTLYFVRQKSIERPELFQVDIDSREVTQTTYNISQTLAKIYGLVILPNNDIFLTGWDRDNNNRSLYQLSKDKTSLLELGVSCCQMSDLAFDAKHNRLFFVKRQEPSQLGSINLNSTSTVTEIFPYPQTFSIDFQPSYCEGTDSIIFISNSSGGQEIWQIKNEKLKQLTRFGNESIAFAPSCSKSGRYVAFSGSNSEIRSHEQANKFALFIYDLKLNTLFPLTKESSIESLSPSWNFDDSAIISSQLDSNGHPFLWTNQFRQNGEHQALNLPFIHTKPGSNSDYFFAANPLGEIWQIATNNFNNRKRLVQDMDNTDWGNWDVYDNFLVYLKRYRNDEAPAYDKIYRLDLNTNETQLLAKFPMGTLRNQKNMTIDKHNQRLVFAYYSKRVSSIQYIEFD